MLYSPEKSGIMSESSYAVLCLAPPVQVLMAMRNFPVIYSFEEHFSNAGRFFRGKSYLTLKNTENAEKNTENADFRVKRVKISPSNGIKNQ